VVEGDGRAGVDPDPVAVAGELVEERHRRSTAAAVEPLPVRADQFGWWIMGRIGDRGYLGA
jgi:hypothetical protein